MVIYTWIVGFREPSGELKDVFPQKKPSSDRTLDQAHSAREDGQAEIETAAMAACSSELFACRDKGANP